MKRFFRAFGLYLFLLALFGAGLLALKAWAF